MIEVWHWVYKNKETPRSGFFGFEPNIAARIARGEDPDFDYRKAAEVCTNDLDDAYMLTNSIDCGWWQNDLVKAVPLASRRSTSMGDMLVDTADGRRYTVATFGFEEFTV